MRKIIVIGGPSGFNSRGLLIGLLAECCVVFAMRRGYELSIPQMQIRALAVERVPPPSRHHWREALFGKGRNRNRSKFPRVTPRSGCRNK